MQLNDWYAKGLTPDAYMAQLDKHKENFMRIYENYTVPADERFFSTLQAKNLRVIVLAEVWCGHCMLDIPILLHLAKAANMPVRFLPRDENLELMDQHLTNGKSRTIPIMLFIDENGNQVGKWGPIAPKVKEYIQQHSPALPEKDDPTYDEKFKELIQMTSKAFTENKNLWNAVYNDIKKVLV